MILRSLFVFMQPIISIIFVLCCFAPKNLSAGVKVESVSADIPRNLNQAYLDLTVVVSGLEAADANPKASEKTLSSRLKIYLLKIDDDETLPMDANSNKDLNFYFTDRTAVSKQTEDEGTYQITFYPRIIAKNGAADFEELLKLEDEAGISLDVGYDDGNGKKDTDNSFFIPRQLGVANQSPEDIQIESSHRSLKITYTLPESISYLEQEAQAPSGVVAVAIKNQNSKTLSAKIFNKNSTLEQDTSCTFTPIKQSGSVNCIHCGSQDTTTYLNTTALENNSDVVFAKSTTNEVLLTGLEKDAEYAVFLYFTPDGVKRSQCFQASSITNYSLNEYSGGNEASQKDPRCFIASAAFGDPKHPVVERFRYFRDEIILKKIPFGESLVGFYYQWSPYVAELIDHSPWLASVSRNLLTWLSHWIPEPVKTQT